MRGIVSEEGIVQQTRLTYHYVVAAKEGPHDRPLVGIEAVTKDEHHFSNRLGY